MGARVVVRRRLEPEEASASGHVWTDVIGIVLGTGPDGLRLQPDAPRRRPQGAAEAGEVFVPAGSIEAAKRIGPRPSPRPR